MSLIRVSRFAPTAARFFSTTPALQYDLSLTDDQKALVDLTRKMVKESIMPKAAEYDRNGTFAQDVVQKCMELGILNPMVETKYGGPGLGVFEHCLICEELGYGCPGMGVTLTASSLGQSPIINAASDAQKNIYLRRLCENPMVAAYCVTEPGNGSNVAAGKTNATKKGSDYVINGQKMWITNAKYASWYFVLARTSFDPKVKPQSSYSGFIVEANSPGIKVGRKEMNIGQRASDTRGIIFEDVVVPKENLIGKEGDGFKQAMGAFERTRPTASALGLGMAQRALDEATKYALERKAFGTSIFNFQAVSFMIADMAIQVENCRNAILKAGWERDQLRNNTYFSGICKAVAGDCAYQNALNAVQILGGNGYNTSYPVEKMLRDSKIFSIFEGTTQVQKIIISREMADRMKKYGTCRTNY